MMVATVASEWIFQSAPLAARLVTGRELSVGPGMGDPYELYYNESRPEVYEKFDWCQSRK